MCWYCRWYFRVHRQWWAPLHAGASVTHYTSFLYNTRTSDRFTLLPLHREPLHWAASPSTDYLLQGLSSHVFSYFTIHFTASSLRGVACCDVVRYTGRERESRTSRCLTLLSLLFVRLARFFNSRIFAIHFKVFSQIDLRAAPRLQWTNYFRVKIVRRTGGVRTGARWYTACPVEGRGEVKL